MEILVTCIHTVAVYFIGPSFLRGGTVIGLIMFACDVVAVFLIVSVSL
jgi:hypothetical protein